MKEIFQRRSLHFVITFYFPAHLVGGFNLSGVQDKPRMVTDSGRPLFLPGR